MDGTPGFPKAHLQKQYTFNCYFFDSPYKTSMVCSIRCFFVSHHFGRWTSTSSKFPQPNSTYSRFASGGFPVWWLFGRGQCYDCYGADLAQIWVKLQNGIEIPTSFLGENWCKTATPYRWWLVKHEYAHDSHKWLGFGWEPLEFHNVHNVQCIVI